MDWKSRKKLASTCVKYSVCFFIGLSFIKLAKADSVSAERLNNLKSEEEAGNWLTNHRSYDSHRFSPLKEINRETVSGLKLAYAVALGGRGGTGIASVTMQATPLADKGYLYVTDGWGTIYKIDATSGKRGVIEWKADLEVDREHERIPSNRGAALWQNLVFTNTVDGRVAAVDTQSGEIVWEKQIATGRGEGFSGAPIIVDDKLIVGQSMGDWLTRGFVAALDPATGEELWRFDVVPEPGQPGSRSWRCEKAGNPDCWRTGGGGVWATGAYDKENGLYIVGTGNPAPAFDPEARPGDNLYTNSVIALDINTGKLAWHFQYTPNDYMEFDEAGTHLLVDRMVKGKKKKTVAHYGRNGFFYRLDEKSGQFIDAVPYVEKVTWTEGIDKRTGKPLGYQENSDLQEYTPNSAPRRNTPGKNFSNCPHAQGGVNFWPTAFDEKTGIAYATSLEACSITSTKELPLLDGAIAKGDRQAGDLYIAGGYVADGVARGSLLAVNVESGDIVNKIMFEYPNYSGVLLTAGKLVFTGHMDGGFSAYDADTLAELWTINLGTEFQAPAMTFSVNGKQYIGILGGGGGINPLINSFGRRDLETMEPSSMLFVFAL
ncbi:MAG: PQQ-binding-like beta-propeller repeat protein [Gammaproteobacteria bacterium]|nr:PQQ-binding-like beta-propeller repeat protein [Gammaproteobacteria bacterium]